MPASHAALLETGAENRTGRDRSCRAFRRALCRYGRRGGRASLSFLMENPYGACCLVRRKKSLLMGVSPSRWIARHITKGNVRPHYCTCAPQLNNSPVVLILSHHASLAIRHFFRRRQYGVQASSRIQPNASRRRPKRRAMGGGSQAWASSKPRDCRSRAPASCNARRHA